MDAVAEVFKAVMPVITKVGDVVFPALGAAASVLLEVMSGAFDAIGAVWQAAWDVASAVAKGIGDAFSGLQRGIKVVWDGITGIVKGAINVLIDAVNGMVRALNGIQVHIPRIGVPHAKARGWDAAFGAGVVRVKEGDLVGARGFEPPTSSSRTMRATKLRHAPTESAPEGRGMIPHRPRTIECRRRPDAAS